MARPLRIHLPGIPHHIVARGNDKQCIFEDDADCQRFLQQLATTLARFQIECASYCLLWNHYHLLLVPGQLPISRAMQQLNSTYCQWFNRRRGRVGHVLQGRFAARIIDREPYLRNVLRYIARNPVEAGLVARPEDWRWSSYRAAAGLQQPESFVAVHRAWNAFDPTDPEIGRQRFVALVATDPPTTESEAEPTEPARQVALRIEQLLEPHRRTSEFTYADRFARRPAVERIVEGAETQAHLREAARMAFLGYGYTLREIGDAVGRPVATVWAWVHGCGVRSRCSE